MNSPPIPPDAEALSRVLDILGLAPPGAKTRGKGRGYEELAPLLEQRSASERFPGELRQLTREFYGEWTRHEPSRRGHDFIVVIPVADRPLMIEQCLQDLLDEVETFGYGSQREDTLGSVTAVIVEDGALASAREKNRRLAGDFSTRGLPTVYWGFAEQERCLGSLPNELRRQLSVLGPAGSETVGPGKGASATRNVALLALGATVHERSLVWFVDSDESWRVRVLRQGIAEDVKGFSFFHNFDALFRNTEVDIVTGHVVGDPPVSPAVMAGRFAEDLRETLDHMSGCFLDHPCPLHGRRFREGHDAAYHDFAALFGYSAGATPAPYACRRVGAHTLREGLADYARELEDFFLGHHPSRQTYFDPAQPLAQVAPARTVYTGNVVLGYRARMSFIPFAHLNLRMAGPVLGRILRRRHGPRFMKANLPLFHNRSLGGGVGEFRAGVELNGEEGPNLGIEFWKQFWGDVMLFSVEELLEGALPFSAREEVEGVVRNWHAAIGGHYNRRTKRLDSILAKLNALAGRAEGLWPGVAESGFQGMLCRCIHTLRGNFSSGAPVVKRLQDPGEVERMIQLLIDAIVDLERQEDLWAEARRELARRGFRAALPRA